MQPEYVTTLEMMGDWLRMAGEAIYGTRAGPVPVSPWGVTTQRPGPWPSTPPPLPAQVPGPQSRPAQHASHAMAPGPGAFAPVPSGLPGLPCGTK